MFKYFFYTCLILILVSPSSYGMIKENDEGSSPESPASSPLKKKGEIDSNDRSIERKWKVLEEKPLDEINQKKKQKALENTAAALVVLKRTIGKFEQKLETPDPSPLAQHLKKGVDAVKVALKSLSFSSGESENDEPFVISDVQSTNIVDADPEEFAGHILSEFQDVTISLTALGQRVREKNKDHQETFAQLTKSFLDLMSGYQKSFVEIHGNIQKVEPVSSQNTNSSNSSSGAFPMKSSPIPIPVQKGSAKPPVKRSSSLRNMFSSAEDVPSPMKISEDRMNELEKKGIVKRLPQPSPQVLPKKEGLISPDKPTPSLIQSDPLRRRANTGGTPSLKTGQRSMSRKNSFREIFSQKKSSSPKFSSSPSRNAFAPEGMELLTQSPHEESKDDVSQFFGILRKAVLNAQGVVSEKEAILFELFTEDATEAIQKL